jgi:ELWxxDGT repeat protein
LLTPRGDDGRQRDAGLLLHLGRKRVWRTDGTEQGTKRLGKAGGTGIFNGSNWRTFFAVGTTLFFESSTPDFGYELWMSDGTVEGTGLAADICPGPNPSVPRGLSAIGTTLLFAATDCEHGRELWAFPVTEAAIDLGSMQE